MHASALKLPRGTANIHGCVEALERVCEDLVLLAQEHDELRVHKRGVLHLLLVQLREQQNHVCSADLFLAAHHNNVSSCVAACVVAGAGA